MDQMHQVKIRHPIEGDELGIDAIFTEIKGILDKDAREMYASWLKEKQEVVSNVKYGGPSKSLVAVKDDRIIGLVHFPNWEDRGWIRLVYVLSEFKGHGIEEILFKEAMQRLKDSHTSLIVYDSPPLVPSCVTLHSATLQSEGFSTLTRVLLEKNVEACVEPVVLPDGYTVKKWNMSLINNFAEVIYEIWGRQDDNIDALFVPEYSTLEDAKESLKQSAEGKKEEWLGLLDTETTLLLCHGAMICGVSECYKWKEKEDSIPIGFVGMLGLIHGYRGKGLGELLMMIILKGFADEGMKYARVNPTVENVPAFNLYKKLGFMEIEERSKVYYWRR